jgi:ribonuclease III
MSFTLLGHAFKDDELGRAALRHSSLRAGRHEAPTFERLEFLGDRVLGLLIAQWLYTLYPQEAEGPLSRRLAALVRASTLAELGRSSGLAAQVQLPPNEAANGGQANDNIIADALEASLGAVYLDGGLGAAQAIVHKLWAGLVHSSPTAERDPKTRLQEWAQARGVVLPRYEVLGQSGPAHAPEFIVEVHLPDGRKAKGQGSSKRLAEQAAALTLLEIVEQKNG